MAATVIEETDAIKVHQPHAERLLITFRLVELGVVLISEVVKHY
jgi:hypothetical protein